MDQTTLTTEVRAELALEAARRNDALTGVGFPDSPLWLALEAPVCSWCGATIRRGKVVRGMCPGCAVTEETYEPDCRDEGAVTFPAGGLPFYGRSR